MTEEDAVDGETDLGDESPEPAMPGPLPTPILGDADAPVTVAVYEDFACAGCRAFHDNVLPHLRREYVSTGVVRYEHRDYPRSVDNPEIYRAASAARAVQATVDASAFYDFAARLFENQDRLGPDLYASLAAEVGADPDAVRRAARDRLYEATIERDRDRGAELGVGAVPAIFVDGEEFSGTTVDGLLELVESKRP